MSELKLEDKLKALRDEYANNLPQQLHAIEQLWTRLEKNWETETLNHFQRAVHQMAGNAGAFGFSDLTDAARPLDELLIQLQDKDTVPDTEGYWKIQTCLKNIKQAATRPDASNALKKNLSASVPASKAKAAQVASHAGELLYLVEDDEAFSALLSVELEGYGYEVKVFNQVKGLPQAIKERPPTAILMDVMLKEGRLAGPKVMFQIQKARSTPLPLIFISARTDLEARLAAVRANGDAYFTKPFEVSALVEKLREITENQQANNYHILIIDDSSQYGDRYAKILIQSGMQARVLTQPMRAQEALDKFPAELILINTQLSQFSGLELAMVIRQQEKYAQLPIIFFAQQFDQTISRAAMIGIGDDYLSENITPPQLVATITNRIKNAQQQQGRLKELRNRDPLTDLFNRQYFISQLKRSIEIDTHIKPMVLLYINLDNYWGVEKIQGIAAVDSLVKSVAGFLKNCAHGSDTLARLTESTFGLLSQHRTLDEARELSERIRSTLEAQAIEVEGQRVLSTCSIGIGIHVPKAQNYQQVLIDANNACSVAQKGGGNRIHLHDSVIMASASEGRQEELIKAIEKNAFSLAFQPITTLHGRPGAYYDVFLRLQAGQQLDSVPTMEFLQVAEQNGLMTDIDRWVIGQVGRRLEDRYRQKNPINFFVRISKASLQDQSFIPWLTGYLDVLAFPRETLIFDLSQTIAQASLKETEAFIDAVCELGFRFALRDFDGSAGALQLFKRLEINLIKLHHDLMDGLNAEDSTIADLDRIVAAAHEQGIAVIAPFVEDVTTLSLLWQHELDYITGYFIQPPGESLDYDFDHD